MATTAAEKVRADFHGAGPTAGLDYDDDHVLRSPSLRFAVAGNPYTVTAGKHASEEARRLIAAVDAVLAQRAANVEALEISFVYSSGSNMYIPLPSGGFYMFPHAHAGDIISAHVAAWLRFAERRVTGSFTLALPTLSRGRRTAAPAATAACPWAAAALTVPAAGAGAFAALGDLLLSHARVEPGGADERNIGRLLSAGCCPRLRRLRLEHVAGLAALRLDAAATLEELRLHGLGDMTSLEVDAPGLRALRVTWCFKMVDDGSAARITAPALETMACDSMCGRERLRFDGAAAVRRLEKVFLYADGPPGGVAWNAGSVGLLQRCTAADTLAVEIAPFQPNDDATEELMGLVPVLPNVTSLAIDAERAHIEASIATFIAKCTQVEHISINIGSTCVLPCMRPQCFCHRQDGWDWDGMKISLKRLREATITGFRPLEHHRSLAGLIIAGAPALEKMTVKSCVGKELDGSLPCDRGHWARCVSGDSACAPVYEWTPDKKTEEEDSAAGVIMSRF
ncbi:hypothetical protein ACP4OV_028015 [Aristida adscensionis]